MQAVSAKTITATDVPARDGKKTLSVIVPVHNEEGNVRRFYDVILSVLRTPSFLSSYDFELIFVNDGSRDRSWDIITALARRDNRVRGICLSRNFGQTAALLAGIESARGDAVVTIDCDLEDPPSLIPDMVAAWRDGNEIVLAKRVYTKKKSFLKRLTSDLFYATFNLVSDIRLETGVSEFRLIDRQVADAIRSQFPERELFLRGLFQWMGFRTTSIPYTKGEREMGVTSYSYKRLMRLAWDGISAFSSFPLRLLVMLGFSITALATVLLVAMSLLRWVFDAVAYSDIAFLVVFIILSNGIILSAIGIVALYLMRIHQQVVGRPSYLVWKRTNF